MGENVLKRAATHPETRIKWYEWTDHWEWEGCESKGVMEGSGMAKEEGVVKRICMAKK